MAGSQRSLITLLHINNIDSTLAAGCPCDGLSCLRATEWNTSPPLNVFHHSFPPSLSARPLARGINKTIGRTKHVQSFPKCWWTLVFSALCRRSSAPSYPRFPLNIINLSTPPPSLSCNDITLSIYSSPVSPSALAELLELQETGHISSSVAKQVSQPQAARSYPTSTSSLCFSLDASGSTSDPNRPVPPT